jgi:type IV pilus assembly protein PilY1
VIEGGTGNYASLGETWSRPLVTRVRVKCTVAACSDGDASTPDSTSKVVLMFGGGYDPNQDTDVAPALDSMGNAIFMADPLTGQRLWWASKAAGSGAYLQIPKMNFSIPSDMTLLDTDGDGATDRIYVGDMGGQLFRIDLDNQLDPGVSNGATSGYVFADIGCAADGFNSATVGTALLHDASGNCPGSTTKQSKRRIYFQPDVAPITDTVFSVSANYDMVTFGSGDREDPLDFLTGDLSTPDTKEAVHNRIYAFRDYDYVTGKPVTTPTSPLNESNLYNATANLLGTSTGAALTAEIALIKAKKGWYIDLKNHATPTDIAMPNGLTTHWIGEKVLAAATIEDGVVKITTYTPANTQNSAATAGTCNANEGEATIWGLNILNAAAAVDFNGDGTADRFSSLGSGIASEVVRIFLPDGNTSLVQAGGGIHAGGPDDKSGGLKRNAWQGCLGAPSGDTKLCNQ